MKKSLLLLFSVFLLSISAVPVHVESVAEQQVYICTGKYSKRYHKNTKCKGMRSCKGEIKKVPLSEAKKKGKSACGYCY